MSDLASEKFYEACYEMGFSKPLLEQVVQSAEATVFFAEDGEELTTEELVHVDPQAFDALPVQVTEDGK